MKLTIATFLFLCPWLLGASGCPNALSSMANKTTDDALLFQAEELADQKDWTDAIAAIKLMTTAGQAEKTTVVLLSSLYAGRCGLDMVVMAKALSDGLGGGKALWPTAKTAMTGATATNVADCELAETTITGSGFTFTDLTGDDNVYIAFMEFAKMGAILAADGADPSNNGTLTVTCAAFSAADVENLMTGLTIAIKALSTAGSTLVSSASTAVTGICSTFQAAMGGTDPCTVYTASGFASVQSQLAVLIKSSEVGYNVSSCGTVSTCTCP